MPVKPMAVKSAGPEKSAFCRFVMESVWTRRFSRLSQKGTARLPDPPARLSGASYIDFVFHSEILYFTSSAQKIRRNKVFNGYLINCYLRLCCSYEAVLLSLDPAVQLVLCKRLGDNA